MARRKADDTSSSIPTEPRKGTSKKSTADPTDRPIAVMPRTK